VAGTAAVGIFRVAQTLLGVVNPLFLALEHILPRRIGEWSRAWGWPTALRRYTKTALLIGAAITAAIVTMGVFGEPLMIIAGGADAAGFGWVVLGLGLVWVPYLVFIMIAFPLRAIERTRAIALSQAVSAVVALLIAVPLVGQFGLAGMILGMFTSYAVGAGVLLTQYRRLRTAEYMQ
jgi:O-antigen/teichoic acid export membrane protein